MTEQFTYEEYKKHYAVKHSKYFPKPVNPDYDPVKVANKWARKTLKIMRKHLK